MSRRFLRGRVPRWLAWAAVVAAGPPTAAPRALAAPGSQVENARAMLADVALVPLDGVSQLNATLGAQGAEGCFALRDVPDALLYAARLKAAAAASLLRRRMLLRRSRSLLQEAYPGVGRMQVNRRVCGMELPSAWLDRGRPSRWSHVGVSHADGGDRVGGRGCVCESKLIGFCQLP